MKKIVGLMLAALLLFSFCACGDETDNQQTTTEAINSYEELLYGEWKRENSDVVMMLTSNNYGTKKQGGLSLNLYWEADAEKILIKENQVGEEEGLPYSLESNTFTIYNSNGTNTVYKRVK